MSKNPTTPHRYLHISIDIHILTYKALNALAPQYILGMLMQYTPARTLRSSNKQFLQVPKFKPKTYGSRLFSYVAPYLSNKLPDTIRQAPLLATFKSKLKTYLFSQAFDL